METALLISCFFIIAFLYSVVGHGGASGYIALMVLFGFTQHEIRPLALELNIAVAGIATWQFYRSGYFLPKLFWPFAISSIPMAWIGGGVRLDAIWFKVILAVCLFATMIRLVLQSSGDDFGPESRPSLIFSLLIGGVIGLLAGMIGIGGGVLLSPVLLLARWSNVKQASAVAAPFILVNSIVALISSGDLYTDPDSFPFILITVIFGGILGSFSGSRRFRFETIRYVLAIVLMTAIVKLVL
ncbi:MAG: sulfite exporter TauE/SafE family protein [Bacteroidota bacterium]